MGEKIEEKTMDKTMEKKKCLFSRQWLFSYPLNEIQTNRAKEPIHAKTIQQNKNDDVDDDDEQFQLVQFV